MDRETIEKIAAKVYNEFFSSVSPTYLPLPKKEQYTMSDDGVTVTENEPRAHRPDNTEALEKAEARVVEVINDCNAGNVSKKSALKLKDAAQKTISGHDFNRAKDYT